MFSLLTYSSDGWLPRQSTPGVLDSGLKLPNQSTEAYDRPARITTELLITFTEASGDTDTNVSRDAILQLGDARVAKAL